VLPYAGKPNRDLIPTVTPPLKTEEPDKCNVVTIHYRMVSSQLPAKRRFSPSLHPRIARLWARRTAAPGGRGLAP
jgi:hypothetical protein